jgi:hypothetical protein
MAKEIQELRHINQDLEGKHALLAAENERVATMVNDLIDENQRLKSELEHLKSSKDQDLLRELIEAKNLNEEMNLKHALLVGENERVSGMVDDLYNETKKLKEQLKNSENLNKARDQEIEKLKQQVLEQDKKIGDTSSENEDLKFKLKQAQNEKELLRSSSELDMNNKMDKTLNDLKQSYED